LIVELVVFVFLSFRAPAEGSLGCGSEHLGSAPSFRTEQ